LYLIVVLVMVVMLLLLLQLDSMEASFSTPILNFLDSEFHELASYRQQADSTKEEYDAAQLEYDVSRTSASVTAKQERSLQVCGVLSHTHVLSVVRYLHLTLSLSLSLSLSLCVCVLMIVETRRS
jgi:hypothetical protein